MENQETNKAAEPLIQKGVLLWPEHVEYLNRQLASKRLNFSQSVRALIDKAIEEERSAERAS
jgi:hypothetical protein